MSGDGGATRQPDNPDIEWISVAEAARRLKRSRASIYGRIERGTLVTKPHGNEGRLIMWPPEGGDVTPTRHPDSEEDEELRREIARLRDTIDAMAHDLADLEGKLATANADKTAAQAIAAAQVAAKDEVVAELKRELEHHRQLAARPWWKRLLGG
jgi:hypothetical protein